MSYNSEILILRYLGRVVPGLEVLLFPGGRGASSVKQTDLRDMFKKTSNSACTSTVVAPPDLLCPTPSTSTAMKTPESKEPDDPEPAAEGDIQMEHSSNWLCRPSIAAVTKNYLLGLQVSIGTIL
jgi:hypothetical protein